MENSTRFRNVVSSEEEIRKILGYPSELVKHKVIYRLDEHCRKFIGQSPLAFLSTSDASGLCDVSPRGDSPGFVHVLDDNRLLIPERPGNRRMDSLRNIIANSHAGLVFVIPGLEETLRVNGRAWVIRDAELLRKLEAHGHTPSLAIGIEAEECYIHCAKTFKRSQLWNPNSWPKKGDLPYVPKILADHAKLPGVSASDVSNSLHESYTKRLY